MDSPTTEPVSIFYSRTGFDPGADLVSSQRDRPVRHVRDFWFFEVGDYWMVTRHADVRQVLGDSTTFGMHDPNRPTILPHELLNMDPPEHTRLRRILNREFNAKRIRELEPRIRGIVADHLDAMESRGAPADIVADFALPIPSLVIGELLGVPAADQLDFQRRGRAAIDMTMPLEQRLTSTSRSREYLAELVEMKRKHSEGDDLISVVIREHRDDVTTDELVGVADVLLFAGHETTSNMLSLGTMLYLAHPDQANRLRAAADDDPVHDRAVEEMMRFVSAVNTPFARIARRDVELGGALVKAGDYVVCQLPIANRDPALGVDMDRFDIGREPVSHVAFSHGAHHCLGAPLARAELRIAFPALLRRFPGLRSVLPMEAAPYRNNTHVYGLDALPVTW